MEALHDCHEEDRYERWSRTAQITQALANIHARGRGHRQAYKIEEFIPIKPKKREQTPEHMAVILTMMEARARRAADGG